MMKQEKNVVPMSTGPVASETGARDIDASTDVLVDDSFLNDEAGQPLSRKLSIPSSRIVEQSEGDKHRKDKSISYGHHAAAGYPLHYGITNPVRCPDAYPMWYDREGEPSQLAAVDIFVSTVDPLENNRRVARGRVRQGSGKTIEGSSQFQQFLRRCTTLITRLRDPKKLVSEITPLEA